MVLQQRLPLGTHVEVSLHVNITAPALAFYGVVRWIGQLPDRREQMAGVELVNKCVCFIECCNE